MATKAQSEYIPYGQREEWKDVTPIPQDDGPNPVCPIAYTAQFTDTMNYFRAVLRTDERSERTLKLTQEALMLNAAHYTAWYFRRFILDTLHSDLKAELELVSKIGDDNPKNYQIWYHRKWCVEKIADFSKEMEYTANQIKDDSKNYHAWAYRQWVIETQGLWDQELEYIESVLKEDIRNNSAWNQRYFVISRNNTQKLTKEIIEREANFAVSFIRKAPNNQSPWTYLKGLFNHEKYANFPTLVKTLQEMKEKYVSCSHASSLLVDIYEQENSKESITQAIELVKFLANHLDTLHNKYWVYKNQKLEALLAKH